MAESGSGIAPGQAKVLGSIDGRWQKDFQMSQLPKIHPLSADIGQLDGIKALAFGIFLLERAMPAFFQFQCDTGWTGGGVMRAALAQCWAVLEGCPVESVSFVSVAECERALPDSEDPHESEYTSAAIDAVDIACNLLEYIKCGDISLIVASATARCDTAELFHQNNESTNESGNACSANRFLDEELDYMQSDLEFLRDLDVHETAIAPVVLRRVLLLGYRDLRLQLG